MLDDVFKKMEEEKRAKMTPEELTKDDDNKKMVKGFMRHYDNKEKLKTGTSKEKEQAKKELDEEKKKTQDMFDEIIGLTREQTQKSIEEQKHKAYENVKRRSEAFRQKHNIKISKEGLEKEDRELRKKFGLE